MSNTLSVLQPSVAVVAVGSGIHDYPDHRKRLITECFRAGLAPAIVPPSVIAGPDAARCYQELLGLSQAYIGFLVHCFRPASRGFEESSIFEAEWQQAVELQRQYRFLLADPQHAVDPALLGADPYGYPKVVELASRLRSEDPNVRTFSSPGSLQENLPAWTAELRSALGLPPLQYTQWQSARSEVFVSYARADNTDSERWLRQLETPLRALCNARKIPLWYDPEIRIGEKWKEEIKTHLDRARIAVLLLSNNFLVSEYIMETELPYILSAADRGELKIVPVLLKDFDIEACPGLAERQFARSQPGGPLVPLEAMSDGERSAFYAALQKHIRIEHASMETAAAEIYPQPLANALLQLCEPDSRMRQLGLHQIVAFFELDAGRPALAAHPYLPWARAQLSWIARDPDPEVANHAERILKSLSTRIPVRVIAQAPAPLVQPVDDPLVRASYVQWVEATHRWLELPGIREIAALPRIELHQVFVALRGDRSTAHERLQARRLLDIEVIQFVRSLNQNPESVDLPRLRRQLLLFDEFMPLHRELVRSPSNAQAEGETITLGEAFRRDRWLVILGEPGSGKTTLVRWLALQLATRPAGEQVLVARGKVDPSTPDAPEQVSLGPARLPVLARIADYAEVRATQGHNARYGLHEFLGRHPWQGRKPAESDAEEDRLNAYILGQLRAGQAVILLDGMDEIARSDLRDVIRADINRFIEQWINGRGDPAWIGRPDAYLVDGEPHLVGGNQIVITSRIVGYQVAPLEGPLTHVLIEPMAEPAVRAFCTAWTRAVDAASHAQAQDGGAAESAGLQEAIYDDSRPRIRELASNPLLITILALLYRRNAKRLPDQRVELYRTAIDVLIDDWPNNPINRGELRAVLPDVAELVHRTSSSGLIETGSLRQVLATSLTRERRADGSIRPDQFVHPDSADIQQFLDIALSRVGIMAGRGDLLLGFVHLTFQEYLAGLWLVRDGDVDKTVARVRDVLDNPRWREPILLALGHAGSRLGWPEDRFSRLITTLIAEDSAIGKVFPRIALLLSWALEEIPRASDDVIAEMVKQLLRALGTIGSATPLRDELDDALQRLRRQRPAVLDALLIDALGGEHAMVTAALIRRREWWTPTIAESLLKALIEGRDGKEFGFPVLMALRDYATPPLPEALQSRPEKPARPRSLLERDELLARRHEVEGGSRLGEIIDEINTLIERLPEALTADESATDPSNTVSVVRQLQRLNQERARLESGEELLSIDAEIAQHAPEHERHASTYARALAIHAEELARFEAAAEEYRVARSSEGPQRPWPLGRLPAQQWFRDDPRRIEEVFAHPTWLLVFLTLYGGVKDYRVGRYEEKYQRSVEGFQEFRLTYEHIQFDGVYQRAVALDNFQPSPRRWRVDFPFTFSPDFFFRHSPIHAQLAARLERGEGPADDDDLLRLLSSPASVVRTEAVLALFASGTDIERLPPDALGRAAAGERQSVAAHSISALEGLLAGWRETLEYLLPKCLPDMLRDLETTTPAVRESLRAVLKANARQLSDPKNKAKALWGLVAEESPVTVCEIWKEALDTTWAVALHFGYDDPVFACESILEQHEVPAAKRLLERFSLTGFERLFAESICPEWAEHPDLVAEALQEYLRQTPARFDDQFMARLLRGKESLPDACAAWTTVTGLYSLAVVLDTCGVKVPNNAGDFLRFALDTIGKLEPAHQARTLLRLARYLPLLGGSPIDRALSLARCVDDPAARLSTYESVLSAMPAGPDQAALADEAASLVEHLTSNRARIHALLRLLPLASAATQSAIGGRIHAEIDRIDSPDERAEVIRQARRWALAEEQAEALNAASQALLDEPLQRWTQGRLPADAHRCVVAAMAAAADPEVRLCWAIAGLAARGEELLQAFGQEDGQNLWSNLTTGDPEAVWPLLALGEKSGLKMTLHAVDAVEWMQDNERQESLSMLLPLLESPVREAWPRLHRWRAGSNDVVAQHAALMEAENGRQINSQTLPHLFALLDSDLDRSRLRAAIVLHGQSVGTVNKTRIPVSRIGRDGLDQIGQALHERRPARLDPRFLEPTSDAGRQRSTAKVLRWLEHQTFFDDAELVKDYLARSAAGDPVANHVLLRMEACSNSVLELLTETLANSNEMPSIGAQQVLLEVLAKLLHCKHVDYQANPGSGRWEEFPSAIQIWVDRLSPAVRREPVLIGDAESAVRALVSDSHLAGATGRVDVSSCALACREILAPLAELADTEKPGAWPDLLLRINLYYRQKEEPAAARAAADHIDQHPEIFPLLVQWLVELLRSDLNDPPLARVRQLLLEAISAFAETSPATFAAAGADTDLLPLLSRVVTFSEHFRSRADAVLLVGAMRRLTAEGAVSFLSALRDVFEVQNAAQMAIGRFRFIDPDAFELLLSEIRPENRSSTALYGAVRLLTGLAATESLTMEQRRALVEKVASMLQIPAVRHRGVYFMTGNGGEDESGFRIRFEARLGDVLYDALLRVAGAVIQFRTPLKTM